jgi:hypothetical protein
MDAYEFSFVAVPAQRDAGVLKGYGANRRLKELAEEFGIQGEYRELWKQAQLGQRYQKQLENEVVRLCLALELGVEEPLLRSVMSKAGAEDLAKMKTALEDRLVEMMPVMTQLSSFRGGKDELESGYLI